MSIYLASEVGFELMTQAGQGEPPSLGFVTAAMGDTLTEMSNATPPEVVAMGVSRWKAVGLKSGRLMGPGSVADQVVNIRSWRGTVRQLGIARIPSD
jgi:hypothetical protein